MKRPTRIRVRLKTAALWERLAGLNRSQNWLAREIGIAPGYLSMLVNGVRFPSACVRRRMQEVLGVEEFDYLFIMESVDDDT